ncbi:MAG: DUF1592 domain-containing protein [Verrucomicrobiia bacterium]|jgi:hypothetical protein
MKFTRSIPVLFGLALLLSAPRARAAHFEKDILPVLKLFCYDCHGDGAQKGGVSFDTFDSQAKLMKDMDLWSRVLSQVSFGNMPPGNKRQPTPNTRQKLLDWIETDVFKVNCNNPDPGRVTIRRLNRTEYNNTIRDLLGISFRPADDFPPDDSGFGFDNIGDVLSISPLHMEKYLIAAEQSLDKAIPTGPVKLSSKTLDSERLQGGRDQGGERILVSNGEISASYDFPMAGEYQLRARAYQHRAGSEATRMGFLLDGRSIGEARVDAEKNDPGDYEKTIRVQKGRRRLAVSFLNDYYRKDGPRNLRGDRNLIVESFSITGPLNQPPPEPPMSQQRIFFKKQTAANQEQVAREIIGAFATRAFRRPVEKEELDGLMAIWLIPIHKGESFELSVKLALRAALSSPAFLFRGEVQPDPDNPNKIYPINEYALASRLSYFLWGSMPDDELTQLASRKRLRSNLAEQTYRMLRSNRALGLAESFAMQWLQIRNLDLVTPSEKHFPDFDDQLKEAMRTETEMLFKRVVREDRSVLEFLNADYTYLNERLAKHYGMSGVKGDNFRLVSLSNSPRRGVLTHGSVLTITSNPTRTSPVKRGLWVLENILGTPPPPPPPDVPDLDDDKEVTGATLRARLEMHREKPVCNSCHQRMDPLGFGLENFDAVGKYREKEDGALIDTAGKLVTGESFTTPAELANVLVDRKRDEFVRTLALRMLTFALGRGPEHYDKCAVDRIVHEMERNDYKFSSLILGVVKSVPFQLRRGEGERNGG